MKKNYLRTLPAALLLLFVGTIATHADEITLNGVKFTSNADNTAYSVSGYDSTLPEALVIPATVNGKPVTDIGDNAFKKAPITSLKFAEGTQVTVIGTSAFRSCANLTTIELPNTLTTIKGWAFFSCTSIETITIPASVTTLEGGGQFNTCKKLSTVVFRPGSKLTRLDDNIFNNDPLTTIDLTPCKELKAIGISSLVNDKLTSMVIPASVETIEKNAFGWTSSLTNLRIEAGSHLKTIGEGAFIQSGITSIALPASVVTIGNQAFKGSRITTITLPKAVTTLGTETFQDCASLTSITFEGNQIIALPDNFAGNTTNLTTCNIPTTVETIGANAFQKSGIETIALPEGLKSIGARAFSASSITHITLPASLSTLDGESQFNTCKSLEKITFAEGCKLTAISNYFTNNCTALKSMNIEACRDLTSIGHCVYAKTAVEKADIPAGVTYIGDWCFCDCPNMQTVVFNTAKWGITLGKYCFAGCAGAKGYYNEEATGLEEQDHYAVKNNVACIDELKLTAVAPIKVGKEGFGTYYNSNAIVLPSQLKAYGVSVSEGQLKKTVLAEDIAGSTGMLVQGVEGIYVPALFEGECTAVSGNLLKGADADEMTEGGDKYYMLSLNSSSDANSIGFYWGADNGGAFVSKAHKAYLALTNEQAQDAKGFALNGVTTGLAIRTDKKTNQSSTYCITGVKMQSDSLLPGIYIRNGKKIIIR